MGQLRNKGELLMKNLITLLFFIAFSAQADWVKQSDFNSCEVVGYYDRHTCENTNSSECVKLPSNYGEACGLLQETLQDVYIDDLSKPLRDKTNVTSCEGEQACQASLESLECEEKYINESYSEVYCSKITGYEQKYSHKIAVVDTDKLAHKVAKQDAIMQIEEAKKYLSETDYMVIRAMEGGEPMPIEVKNQRAAKRALINSLEAEFDL